jgi:hypothetical protein
MVGDLTLTHVACVRYVLLTLFCADVWFAGDSFVRAAVLSDLLEVNRLLQQLKAGISSGAATLEQLLHTLVAAGTAAATLHALHSNRAAAAGTSNAAATSSHAAATAAQQVSADALAAAFSRMAAQLQVCNENVHSFKALYAQLASDRAELTREIVLKVMQQGTYTFTTAAAAAAVAAALTAASEDVVMIDDDVESLSMQCQVEAVCSYPRSYASSSSNTAACSERQLSLDDLQELRSRVMLLSGSSSSSSSNAAGAAGTAPMELDELTNGQLAGQLLLLFAEEVSAATSVVSVAGQLLELGCFSYRSWHQQVSATADPTQRLAQLQQLLAGLQADLAAWQLQLAAAQARCKWFNYFHPRQLFVLEQLLCGDDGSAAGVTQQEQRFALAALQFVQPNMQQQQLADVRAHIAAVKAKNSSSSSNRPDQAAEGSAAVQAAAVACDGLEIALNLLFCNNVDVPAASTASHADAATGSTAADPGAIQPAGSHSVSSSSSSTGLVTVLTKDADARSISVLLQARAAAGCGTPQAAEVVSCSSSTSWWDVQLLLQRCFPALALAAAGDQPGVLCTAMDASSSSSGSGDPSTSQQQAVIMYALCDADALPLSLQSRLVEQLLLVQAWYANGYEGGAVSNDARLLITCTGSSSYLTSQLAAHAQAAAAATAVAADEGSSAAPWLCIEQAQNTQAALGPLLQQMMQKQQCCAVVMTSDLPGQGKTTAAARLAAAQGKQLYHVLLTDDLAAPPAADTAAAVAGGVIGQLCNWDPAQHVLHLQLLGCSNAAYAEQLLFGLLVLSHVTEDMQAYHRPAGPCSIVVEVGNSMVREGLLQQMPLLAAAEQLQGLPELLLAAGTDTETSSSNSSSSSRGSRGSSMPCQGGFWQLHCGFDLQQVDTSAADIQLLCTYLHLQETGQLDAVVSVPRVHCATVAKLPRNWVVAPGCEL